MDIRRAAPDEVKATADLYIRSRAAAVPAIPPSVHDDEDVRGWFSSNVFGEWEPWVAVEDATIVGLLTLHDDWVEQLYLEPGWTGRGIGSGLVEHAKARRPEGLQLWAFQSNTGARRFYERHGFVAVEETDGDNEEGEPDVRYRWPR